MPASVHHIMSLAGFRCSTYFHGETPVLGLAVVVQVRWRLSSWCGGFWAHWTGVMRWRTKSVWSQAWKRKKHLHEPTFFNRLLNKFVSLKVVSPKAARRQKPAIIRKFQECLQSVLGFSQGPQRSCMSCLNFDHVRKVCVTKF